MRSLQTIQSYLGILAVLTVSTLRADQMVAKSADLGPAPASTTGRHNVAVGPAGSWFRQANAYDSGASPTTVKGAAPLSGPYPTPIANGAATTGLIQNPGTWFNPRATGCLTYGSGFWDSSCSGADIVKLATGTAAESAMATALADDPAQYEIQFSPGFQPEVLFSMTFSPSMELISQGGTGFSSSTFMSGNDATDLLAAPLWSWSWSADSAHPNSSTFQFQSNPLLHLNDANIQSAFMANLMDSAGVHTMTQAMTITASVFPNVTPGSTLDYTFGGSRTFEADAAATVAPEPHELLLMGSGLIAVSILIGKKRRSTA